jgi:hypothetical protein
MPIGVDVFLNANQWVISYDALTATHTLPYQLWPDITDLLQMKPFLPRRMVWTAVASAAGNQVILQDSQGATYVHFVASGADYQPPQEWKRSTYESGPMKVIITQFDVGELIIYL